MAKSVLHSQNKFSNMLFREPFFSIIFSIFLKVYLYLGQQNTTLDPLSNREYTWFKQHKQVKCKKMMNAPLLLDQVSIFEFAINIFVWLLSSIKHQSHLWQSDSESERWSASELHSWWISFTYNLLDQTLWQQQCLHAFEYQWKKGPRWL